MGHFDDKTCLERTPLPVRTPTERLEAILSEKKSILKIAYMLQEEERKVRKELFGTDMYCGYIGDYITEG